MSESKLLPCHLLTVGSLELKPISQSWPYVESGTSATSPLKAQRLERLSTLKAKCYILLVWSLLDDLLTVAIRVHGMDATGIIAIALK